MSAVLHPVRCSPRMPAGSLSAEAWQRCRDFPVLVPHGSRHAPALRSAGCAVQEVVVDAIPAMASGGGAVLLVDSPAPDDPDGGQAEEALVAAWRAAGGAVAAPIVEPEPAGARVLDLVRVMDRLRSPGGCPWDARQTHASLLRYLVEEAYEVVDAVELGDDDHLREELGDVLLQVAFHSRIAQERPDAPWSIDEVADGIVAKLVRRHPHVFARDASDPGPDDDAVEADWQARKAAEKGRRGVLEGVPRSLPALALLAALLERTPGGAGAVAPALPEATDPVRPLLDAAVALIVESGDADGALRAAVLAMAERIDAAVPQEPR